MKATALSTAAWETVRAGNVLTLVNGRAFKPSEWQSHGLPIVRIQNLNNPEAPFNYYDGELPEKFLVDDDDLLFAWSGTPGTSFGAHIWRRGKAWLNQHIFKVLFDAGDFDRRFLRLAINQNLNEYIRLAHGGAGLAHITKGRFEDSLLLKPPLDEQVHMVEGIEQQLTRLDAGVAALKHVQAHLKRYRAAVLKAACEGRLVPTEAALARQEARPYEPASALLERIAAEKLALAPKTQRNKSRKRTTAMLPPDLPRHPEGWQWATADQLTRWITDGEHLTPRRSAAGILLLSARNIRDGRISFDEVDFVPADEVERIERRLRIEAGDVLLSCSGTVGRTCAAPPELRFTLVRSVAVLRPLFGMGLYISLALRSPQLQAQIATKKTQTAQSNLFQGRIRQLVLPVPPLAEQHHIVAEVERRLSLADDLDRIVNANIHRATRFRQSLLRAAFAALPPQGDATGRAPAGTDSWRKIEEHRR
jgi:type I restriction enzyme, S subunit